MKTKEQIDGIATVPAHSRAIETTDHSLSGRPTLLLVWIAQVVLAAVFLYAGGIKLVHPGTFHVDVLNFQWIGDPLAAWIVLWLPVLEVLCGAAILIPAWSRAAALVLAGLLVAFLIALIRAWLLGLNIHCGCFGSSDNPVNYPWKLAQNTALLLAALAVCLGTSEELNTCDPNSHVESL